MNRSPADRSAPNDPQTRRILEGALQRTDLGESLMLDSRGNAIVKPARAVKALAVGEDVAGLSVKIAQLATGATLVDTVAKVQEVVTAANAVIAKLNGLATQSNKSRRAAETSSFALVDSLKSAKLMEK